PHPQPSHAGRPPEGRGPRRTAPRDPPPPTAAPEAERPDQCALLVAFSALPAAARGAGFRGVSWPWRVEAPRYGLDGGRLPRLSAPTSRSPVSMLAGTRVVGRMGPPKGKNAVHLRPLRSLAALCFASTLFLGLTPSAYAGPKDRDAQKLFDKAINEDYLNADFDKAEKKLKEAVTKCGSSGCSPELLAKIYVALGTVHGVGQNKSDDAKSDFVSALKADPSAALDPALTTPELTKIFADAKKSAGNGSSSGSSSPTSTAKPPAGDANHTPPPESQVNTPLPIYIEPSEDVALSKVVLRYKPFGATQ